MLDLAQSEDRRASQSVRPRIAVWDLPTRLFHWTLVGAVGFALGSGLLAPKTWDGAHMIAGYVVAALLLFRAVWAFHGSGYSRLNSFRYSARQTLEHLAGLLRRRPGHYIGHNPSGAAMILALFAVLSALVATGFVVQGGVEKQGPLAFLVPYALAMPVRSLHKLFALLLLAMILLHLAGVLAGSWLFKERLVGAMIDGRKPVPGSTPAPAPARALPALGWLAGLGGTLAVGLWLLSRLPAFGMPDIPPDKAMLTECGACHRPFHPSLLPRAAWARLMANLGDHFGEDAGLPAATREEIAAYLERYAAESWDSKAAHRFSLLSPDNPVSITATPAWQRLHRAISPAAFRARAVGSRANCAACHGDADSGRFDPQAISIPEGAEN
jgi:cytochrome b